MTTQGKAGSLLDVGLEQVDAHGEYTPTEEEINKRFQELRESINTGTETAERALENARQQVARWKEMARQQEEGIAKFDPKGLCRRKAAILEAALLKYSKYKEDISSKWKQKVHKLVFWDQEMSILVSYRLKCITT